MREFWIEWIRNIFKKETNPNEELKPMKCIKIGEHLPFSEMAEKQYSSMAIDPMYITKAKKKDN